MVRVLNRVVLLGRLLPTQSLFQVTQKWERDEEAVWRTPSPVLASSPSISSYPIPVTLLNCSFFPLSSSALCQQPIPSSGIPLRHDRALLESRTSVRVRCHLDGEGVTPKERMFCPIPGNILMSLPLVLFAHVTGNTEPLVAHTES